MTTRFVLTPEHASSLRTTLAFESAKRVGLVHGWAANLLLDRDQTVDAHAAVESALAQYLPALPDVAEVVLSTSKTVLEVTVVPVASSGPMLARLFADHPRPGRIALSTPVWARADGSLSTHVSSKEFVEDATTYLLNVRATVASHLLELRSSLAEDAHANLAALAAAQ
jgi:hypothetical protein